MSKGLEKDLKGKLDELRSKGLYNEIDILDGHNGAEIQIKGKTYINLSSNNYLGLVMHPRMIKAGVEGIQKYGVGAGAVRSINGTLAVHEELERRLAKFKGTEASIVYQSGFNCNMATIGALMEKEDLILSDELNHASIIDGCKLSPAKVIRVNHSDMTDLHEKAKYARESGLYRRIMFITDGVFSMDGDVCLLPEIVAIAKEFDLITYVDDAHGSGVMGKGAGTTKHFGLAKDVDVQMGTLSKAVGVVGGYIAGSQTLIDWLKVKSRPFLFSTSLSPTSAAACIEGISIMEESTELHDKLWENGNYLKKGLKDLGFDIGHSETPITPCLIGDENLSQKFSRRLHGRGRLRKSDCLSHRSAGHRTCSQHADRHSHERNARPSA